MTFSLQNFTVTPGAEIFAAYAQFDYNRGGSDIITYSGDIWTYRGQLINRTETYGDLEDFNVEFQLNYWSVDDNGVPFITPLLPPSRNIQPEVFAAILACWNNGGGTYVTSPQYSGTASVVTITMVIQMGLRPPEEDQDTLMTIERIEQTTAQEKINQIEAGIERNLMQSFEIGGYPDDEILYNMAEPTTRERIAKYAARIGQRAAEYIAPAGLAAAEMAVPATAIGAAAYADYKLLPYIAGEISSMREESSRYERYNQMKADTVRRG